MVCYIVGYPNEFLLSNNLFCLLLSQQIIIDIIRTSISNINNTFWSITKIIAKLQNE